MLIEKPNGDIKTNDVVLYKRDNQQYLLHRVVRVEKSFYITRGDNRYINEKVYKGQIIGVLSGFYKGDKFIT